MACPFLDPSMLARLPAEKREEMKEMYHRMKKEQSDHLKIDVKDDDFDNVTPEQMMMGMTGASSDAASMMGGFMMGGDNNSNQQQQCPMMMNQQPSSGGQETYPQTTPNMDSFQDQFENDP